ncbi:tapasin-like, partial [Chamaea fasciata]|uniref:tapasin-like n=1 Tax=Chamaea fasciata TaxID=190680 RepID=UPI00336A45DE
FGGGSRVLGSPPPELQCPLLDERGSPSPRPALLRLLGGPGAPPELEPPRDPQRTFDVIDPWGVLGDFWDPSRDPPRCELSPTAPLLPPPERPHECHPGQGTRWWLLALGTRRTEGTVLLQELAAGTRRVNASLFISTATPKVRGLLGTPQTLRCSLSPPPGLFSLEWLHHRDGVTRRLLAFDSVASRVTGAAPGVLLLLGDRDQARPGEGGAQGTQPPGGALELSLQLPPLSVSDDGSFVCSVATPQGQLQQVLRMNVIAPPQVSLVPPALSPGLPAELRCDAVGFFPLDVGIRWERRARGGPQGVTDSPGDASGVTWSSGHRRAADGTFSRSAGLRVAAVTAGDSYSCLVTHPAWDAPHRVTVRVAGATGPSVEETAGVALVAFVIAGLCLRLWPPGDK